MELQDSDEEIISTSNSNNPQNLPLITEIPSQRKDHPTNKEYEKNKNNINELIIPSNNQNLNSSNEIQFDQNISQIIHKNITQPQKNIFIINTGLISKYKSILILIIGIIFIFVGLFGFFIQVNNNLIFLLGFMLLGLVIAGSGVYDLFKYGYTVNIILEENFIKVISKAFCCINKVINFQKENLFRIEFDQKSTKHHSRLRGAYYLHTYQLIFFLKGNLQKEIFSSTTHVVQFSDEEMKFITNFVNDYIKNKIKIN